MSDVEVMVAELWEFEQRLGVFGWGENTRETQESWEMVHAELNRFFSPLEIRRMVWGYGRGV